LKHIIKYILLWVTFILPQFNSFGQNKKNDSLRIVISHSKEDTNKVNVINELAWEYRKSNADTAIILSDQALLLAKKLNWKKGEAKSERQIGWFNYLNANYDSSIDHYNKTLAICEILIASSDNALIKAGKAVKGKTLCNIGVVFYTQSDYPKALGYYLKGLKTAEEIGDKQQVGSAYNNIGSIYNSQSNYPSALEYYLKSLKIAEEVGDKKQVGTISGNIAGLYLNQTNYTKALEYFYKDLKIAEELGDKKSVGITYGNIGAVHSTMGNSVKALDYYLKSLKIAEEFDDKRMLGGTLYNIGDVYNDQGDHKKALEYYLLSLKIGEETGDKRQIGITLGNIGSLKAEIGQYKEAEDCLKKAIILLNEIGDLSYEKEHEKVLSDLYDKTNRPALALEHYKKYIALRDTIFNEENNKKMMRSEMNFEFDKKEAIAKAEHKSELEKQQAVSEEKNHKQKIIIWSVAIGLLLVVVFAGFVFRSLRFTRKQKQLIEIKNKETEEQKLIIEVKQKEILDSIRYAKRIQKALMPSEKYIDKKLNNLNKN
jgi:tetratricopeptide (TPR) repeat protein